VQLTPRHRQELTAIAALLSGVFVGLSLFPLDLTGRAGQLLGRLLWLNLGTGSWFLALLGIGLGLAGFGRLGRLRPADVAVLFLGLVPLVPFGIALAIGIATGSDFPPSYEEWSEVQKLVGVVPAALASGLTSAIGTAGAVTVWLVALSALTLVTLDWHPFRRLSRADRQETAPTVPSEEVDQDDWEVITPPPPSTGETEQGNRNLVRARSLRAGVSGGENDELPPLDLLHPPPETAADAGEAELDRLGQVLIDTLATFRVEGKIVGRTTGPVVTQFEVAPAPGVKVGRIAALADDLALAMRAQSIRIVAPIPGKAAVGVEVPNPTPRIVTLRELLESPEWERTRATLPIALGRDLEGRPVIADLAKMPHLLIAGTTGSGKSVCINAIITSLIYRYTRHQLRMLMVDPKMVELSAYNALPHLRHPVVTDNRDAVQVLKWAIYEMEGRYERFHGLGAKNLYDYNRRAAAAGEEELPFVVLIVDELADLMMTVQGEVEKPLAVLAQKARATGIHLVLATQRPSVNVITGLIKANFPSRIAFRVASKVDSRTILDQNGAETLLGNGDMLFVLPGRSEPLRLQGAFISTEETEAITSWYRARAEALKSELGRTAMVEVSEEDILEVVREREALEAAAAAGGGSESSGERDPLFREAAEVCIQHQLGSTSLLQRKLRIGYGRAARIIDQLHEAGILGPPDGSKPREVLIGMHQLDEYCR
jgi:S-DNA-T family DNA segregation ATPase FtsK/SpoIIIE